MFWPECSTPDNAVSAQSWDDEIRDTSLGYMLMDTLVLVQQTRSCLSRVVCEHYSAGQMGWHKFTDHGMVFDANGAIIEDTW